MIQLFNETELSIFTDDQQRYWFLAKDVLSCLELSTNNVSKFLDRHVTRDFKQQFSFGVGRPSWYILEPGIYQLAFKSSSIKALEFQKWVFEEVLPKLRKEGGYINPEATPEQLEGLQNQIKELQAKYEIAVEDCHQMSFESFAHICYDCFGITVDEYEHFRKFGYGFKYKNFPTISYEKLLTKIHQYFNRLVLMEHKPDFRTPAKQAEIIAKWNEERPGKPKNARPLKVTSLFQQKHQFFEFLKFLVGLEEDKLVKEGLVNWINTVKIN